MSFAMAFGGIDETYRRIGWPSRPIRNLTKFQSSVPGRLPVRKSYTPLLAMQHRVEVGRQFSGFGSSQRGKPRLQEPSAPPGVQSTGSSLTVILAMKAYGCGGVEAMLRYVSISKLEAGSCNRNWLHGKAMMLNPSPANCSSSGGNCA